MTEFEDTFGMAFMAHHKGEASVHQTERDDGLIRESDASMYFQSYDEWPEYEREAMLESKGRVLDVGLGAGRHSLWLQEKGYDVVGMDLSPLAVEVSKLRGVRDCRVMDMRSLDFPDGSFDTVLMMGANLGIAGEVPEVQGVLSGLDRVTAPDGIIIGSTRDPLKTEDPTHLAYHEMNRQRGKPPGLVRIRVNFREHLGDWFEFLMMGEAFLAEVIEPTNWETSKIYGSGNGDYIAILRKKDRD
jgi:SAM-dependent methyltransferase